MRFTALLLLAALAGALVCAQDATTGPALATEDPASLQSDAPQETTIAARTSAAAQEPTTKQRKSPLESLYEKEGEKIEDFIKRADEEWSLKSEEIKDKFKKKLEGLKNKLHKRFFA